MLGHPDRGCPQQLCPYTEAGYVVCLADGLCRPLGGVHAEPVDRPALSANPLEGGLGVVFHVATSINVD